MRSRYGPSITRGPGGAIVVSDLASLRRPSRGLRMADREGDAPVIAVCHGMTLTRGSLE